MVMQRASVYQECSADLVRFATGLVGPHDAADVVSDAVMRVMWSPQWQDVAEPRRYLMRAVWNEAMSHHRTTMRRRARESLAARREPEAATPPDPVPEILDAVSRLSMRQRAVIILTYWADHPPATIAGILDISEGSVRRHLARARERLRRSLR